MNRSDLEALQAILVRLREVNASLDKLDAGMSLIHLDASIAALESQIGQIGMTIYEDQAETANDAALVLDKPDSQARDPL